MNPCEICDGSGCDYCCMSCEEHDIDNDRCKADGCRWDAGAVWDVDDIRKVIGLPAAYEGLAEEAVELAHAALKVARILRGDNPTPADLEKDKKAVREEYTDLMIYVFTLGIALDPGIYIDKIQRMRARIREAKA